MRVLHINKILLFLSSCLLLLLPLLSLSQSPAIYSNTLTTANSLHPKLLTQQKDLFRSTSEFIENKGQYGTTFENQSQMGEIQYGFEGFDMPILFTNKGFIHIQRKIVGPTEAEREAAEKLAKNSGRENTKEQELVQSKAIDQSIAMEWLDANPDCKIVASEEAIGYHTYGLLQSKSKGFKKLRYVNLYPGIDIELSFNADEKVGFEYKISAQAGADITKIKMRYSGDVTKLKINSSGDCIIKSVIDKITVSAPVAFYADSKQDTEALKTEFVLKDQVLSFAFPSAYDKSKTLIIDPFVSSTANLTGANLGKAKDVDFDYAGNVYVTGGGDGTVYKLAKFDAAGVLQWTFSGSMTLPTWSFGTYYGGWVVEKTTGNVYLGQGFAPSGGFRIIRMSTTGLYDNYITTANPSFLEDWKMYWNCNFGSAQILIAGGGTNSNINMGICTPPSTVIASNNVTGIPYSGSTGWAQDMVDIIIDPLNNDMYTIYGSLIGTTSLTNKIYKNTAPYSGASVAWNTPSGYTTVQEIQNRPYLAGPQIDNSANMLAVNSAYFFYWDGKNLKAFDKASGATVGTPLTLAANTALQCGGIIADECNNIFIGSINGVIKVYNFNGSIFNDAAAADIIVPGFGTANVYDLAYYEAQKLIYASGNGFVASFDVSSYACANVTYSILTNPDCATLSVTSSINPTPPSGATVTYTLFNGATQIGTNTSGTFSGLSPNISYTLKAYINLVCSGVVSITTFTLPGPTIGIVSANTTCGNSTGSITATGSLGTAPYSYSKNGVTFQASGTFAGLPAGIYTVTVKDVNGCFNTKQVTILNSNGPTVTCTKTDAICGTNNGSVTATGSGGVAPLLYSVDGVTFQSNNFITGLVAGTYTLIVKDANGCTNALNFTISNLPGPQVTAIPSATFCNSNNGSINAYGTGGVAPLQYSINGNIFQASGLFTGLAPGAYTVSVKDANGCMNTYGATIPNSPAPTVTATATAATCNNANGTVTATGTGGTAPLQYSSDGISFQSSTIFYGLTAGIYTITVKDANSCTSTFNVTVGNSSAPQITVNTTLSACSSNTGTITATGSGGFGALQYSINGITFQASTLFTGLAAGTYTVLVKDANGCLAAAFAIVGNTAAPTISLVTTPTACSGSNGIITATGLGGTAPLQYSIDGITYQASGVFSGLATGNYTITVKDANGCMNAASTVMTNVAGLSVSASNVSSACTSNNGFITAAGLGGVAPLQYSINGVTFQASPVFINLGGGTYTVTVKDANGCKASTIVNLTVSAQPQVSATVVDASCTTNSGSITAIGSSGTPPFRYSINGVTFQSSTTFNNIAAGTYTVTMKDTVGCTATTVVIVNNIGAGPGVTSFTVVTKGAYLCNGGSGKITNPKVNGATCNACTYSLDNGPFIVNATQLYTSVTPGTHTLTVIDANGCSKTISVLVPIPANSTATPIVTGTACNTSNGVITLVGVGPNTPYHVSMNGIGGPWIDFDPSYTFTGLAPGIYTFIMADDESFDVGPPIIPGGCLDTVTVIVPATGGPTILASHTDETCSLNDGSITDAGSTGNAPLSFTIDGLNYQSTGDFYNLSAGIYTLTVQDGTGCESSITITIAAANPPQVDASATNATCGNNNGTITAIGSGGVAPLEYSINTTTFQASPNFTNVSPGIYTVYVKDINGCYGTTNVVVANTSIPKVTSYSVSATCNSNNGALIAVGTLGTPPYQFSLNGTTFQSSTTFTNLNAGSYTITIKDASGCISTTSGSVGNISAPTVTLAFTSAKCFNANGTITATGAGGVAPLQYSINGIAFQVSNIFSGLISGSYTITVKDVNGCLSTKSILVTNTLGPQILTATFTNSSCGNSNGSITASASGGVAPLQYSIDGITFQAATLFSNIAAGTYTLIVKDANACTKTTSVTLINLPNPTVTLSAASSSCFANDGSITATGIGGTGLLTYSKNGVLFQSSNVFTGLAAGSYTITVKDSKGCLGTATITVGSISGVTVSAVSTAVGCASPTGTITATGLGGVSPYQYSLNGVTFQASNVFTGLTSGNYTVTIKDANNCTGISSNINISNSGGAAVSAVATPTPCGVSTGTITATGIGGTTPYQYSINGITYQASNVFNGLAAGTYTIYIKDASTCINTTPIITIVNTAAPNISGISTQTTCGLNNATITATAFGGLGPYQYALNAGAYQGSNLFSALGIGSYVITVKDANNCTANSAVVTITAAAIGSVSNAGVDQLNLCGITSTTLAANTPVIGIGTWSILSGVGGIITSPSSPSSTFTGVLGNTYLLRWTITNVPCTPSTDDVSISFNASPSAANAGPDQLSICGTTSANLAANIPAIGIGAWSIISGAGGSFTLNTNPTTNFIGVAGSTYILRWTIINSSCPATTDDVTISFNNSASTANAGPDQVNLCGTTTATLAANTPTFGTGTWSIVSGVGGTIALATNPSSTFTGIIGNTYILRWTTTLAPCASSSDDVTITFNSSPSTANAGADQLSLCGVNNTILAANAPVNGTGVWSVVSGAGASFALNTNPTTIFTGTIGTTYVLRWTISKVPCTPSSDDLTITFNSNPSAANAGVDQLNICGANFTSLAANIPTAGTGSWSIVSGVGGSFSLATNPTALFTGISGNSYVLRWTISNAPCTASFDDVNISFNVSPTTANAGPDQLNLCGLSSTNLAANTATFGSGSWSIVSGAGGSFSSNLVTNPLFTGLAGVTYVLRWTISNAPCTASFDDVTITFNKNPTSANAGIDQLNLCGTNTTTMAANTPIVGTGAWSVVSGVGGFFTLVSDPISAFTGILGNTYTLRWTISNAPCASSSDDVTVTFNTNPSAANAGADQLNICGTTNAAISANVPLQGTGSWSILSGVGGSIASSSAAATTLTGIAGNTYVLRWTISKAPCTPNTDDVTISFTPNPSTANAGLDQINLCGVTSATLSANAPLIGTGNWTIMSGTGGSFTLSSNPTTTFTGLIGTSYTLRWTISNAPCTPSRDDVLITFNANPSAANAGPDQVNLCGTSTTILAATAPAIGSGLWSIVSGTGGAVSAANNPASSFTGIIGNSYVLRWTNTNATCAAANDDVTITFNANPSTANAGADKTILCGNTSTALSASTPLIGTGTWSIVSGTGGTISTLNSPISNFSGTLGTSYVLRWAINNAPCIPSFDDVIVNIGTAASVSAFATNATCGNSNGSITASGSGGTPPYQYSINGVNFQNSSVFTNLAAGMYTVSIKDINNCTTNSAALTITNSGSASLTASTNNSLCGSNNGSITASASAGTLPYLYSIDGITFQANPIFTNLLSGPYTLTVKDGNNCISTIPVTLANTAGATVSATSTNTACVSNTGTITANGLAGTLPYQFSLDGITFQNSPIFTALGSGSYIVTIKDANNCKNTSAPILITTLGGASISATTTNSSCGASNGSLTVTGTGGALPYQYSLDGITFQSSNVFNALAAATYTVTIRDANLCVTTSAPINLNNTNGANVTGTSNNSTCGLSNGSITATGSAGTTPYQFSLDGITFQNSNLFSALLAGNYTITIKDAANCISTSPVVVVSNIAGASVNATTSNSICGASNGIITAIGIGGTPPFTYSLNGTTFQNSTIFSGLAAGPYTVIIKDANNCIANSGVINLNNTNGATVSGVASNTACGQSIGSITATGNGGALPYQYSLNGGAFQSSNVFTGLGAAVYTLAIKDGNNCISNAAPVSVNNNGGASVTASSTNSLCGAATGSITAIGSGGASPYLFAVNSGVYQSSPIFNSLLPGNYSISIKDANNCIASIPVTVNNTSGATMTAVTVNSTCGASNGTLTATALGGLIPYQYSINGITFQTSNQFNMLAAATYTVSVKDGNNCITNASPVILSNTSGATVSVISTNSTCGNPNGSLTATGIGGTAPYQFSLDGITFQSSNIFSGLSPASYTVSIKDANNCVTISSSITINNSAGALVNASITNSTCGASNGSISVTGTGGVLPYQFSLDGITFQSNSNFNGLPAASYTVFIKDANNCTTSSSPQTLINIAGATVSGISTNSTCGSSNGSITANGLGGTSPYQYSINGVNFQSAAIFAGLAANTYTLTIKDANNCVANSSPIIVNNTAGASVTALVSNATCGLINGSINATGIGGTSPYSFSINGTSFQTSSVFNGLGPASYTVTIKDANNCISISSSVSLSQTPAVIATTSGNTSICIGQSANISAVATSGQAPYSYSWNNGILTANQTVSPSISNTYSVFISDANNCSVGPLNVLVNVKAALALMVTKDDTICIGKSAILTANASGGNGGPYSYTWSASSSHSNSITVTPSISTNYTVEVNDGCTSPALTKLINITVNPLPTVAFSVNPLAGCEPLKVQLTASPLVASSIYKWTFGDNSTGIGNNAGHTYTHSGQYSVKLKVITDQGCTDSLTKSNLITVYAKPKAKFTANPWIGSTTNPNIEFHDLSIGAFDWMWDFGDFTGTSTQPNPLHTYLDSGHYAVQLIVKNTNDCYDTAEAEVIIDGDFTIYIPNSFTPNDDGLNDFFAGQGVGIKNVELTIFDRWGKEFFYQSGLNPKWDGHSQFDDKPCQQDVYIYQIKVLDVFGKNHLFEGRVTLFR